MSFFINKNMLTKKIINILKEDKTKPDFSSIYFADFETVLVNNVHFLSCYSITSISKKFACVNCLHNITETNLSGESQLLIEEFLEKCFLLGKSSCIYFHNLGKFDSFFLINYLMLVNTTNIDVTIKTRNKVLYELICKRNNISVSFKDSYLLFPQSLSTFGKIFNVRPKINFNHDNIKLSDYSDPNFLSQLKNYCLIDSKILNECFQQFIFLIYQQFGINGLKTLTLSALAFKIFRTQYLPLKYKNNLFIFKSEGFKDQFIRQSYKGGLVNVYRPFLEKGYFYDVNSLYPYIMKTCEMPLGPGIHGNALLEPNFDITNFFGFISVDVECPEMYIPFLTVKDKVKGLIAPIGKWGGVYFSEEIKYALTLGYKFHYKSYYKYDHAVLFDDFVNDLYKKRLEYKPGNLGFIYKLILNSLSGRFGMSFNAVKTKALDLNNSKEAAQFYQLETYYGLKEKTVFNNNKVLVSYQQHPDIEDLNWKLKNNIISSTEFKNLVEKLDKSNSDMNISVHIASAITAYARIYMHKFKNKYKDSLYYSDTDSLILNKQLNDEMVSDKILGLFKLEGIVNDAIFIASKFYYLTLNGVPKVVTKGVNNALPVYNDFKNLLSNKSITYETTQLFHRNYTDLELTKKDSVVTITGAFNKRDKIYRNHTWIDTKPLYYNQEKTPLCFLSSCISTFKNKYSKFLYKLISFLHQNFNQRKN